jgi:uncharacterized metal-binding protein YceD (DUF177 family)
MTDPRQGVAGDAAKPEFSRPVQADSITQREATEVLQASEAERAALAARFGLIALDRLAAKVRLRRVRGGELIRVVGELEAEVVQACVVTLEPVAARLTDSFQALFAPPHLVPKDADEIEVYLEEEREPPEPIENGRIDLGELVAQHLSLALDPYPRAPGAAFVPILEHEDDASGPAIGDAATVGTPGDAVIDAVTDAAKDGEPDRPNPFAALARLKPRS